MEKEKTRCWKGVGRGRVDLEGIRGRSGEWI